MPIKDDNMADVIAEVDEGFSRTAKDLFSGACGGVAQVLIGMSNHLLAMQSCCLLPIEIH